MSKPISLYLSVFHSPLVFSVEHYKLEFLGIFYSPPLEITEHNEEQHIKDYSSLFAQVILLLLVILHLYYLLYDGLLS